MYEGYEQELILANMFPAIREARRVHHAENYHVDCEWAKDCDCDEVLPYPEMPAESPY